MEHAGFCSCCGARLRQLRAEYVIEGKHITVFNPHPLISTPIELIFRPVHPKNYQDTVRPYVKEILTGSMIEEKQQFLARFLERKNVGDKEKAKETKRIEQEIEQGFAVRNAGAGDISSATWSSFYTNDVSQLNKWRVLAWLEGWSNEEISSWNMSNPVLLECIEHMKADKRKRIVSERCTRDIKRERRPATT